MKTKANLSSISFIGYEPRSRILEIQFHDGDTYQYFEVPMRIYILFVNAPSKEAFLNYYVKKNFHYAKVDEQAA